MDNELMLYDRIEVIKTTDKKYDLEHNAYLSFSGGKDSTILHYLLDMALPNNNIPRVFIDTGIEYQMIRDFVLDLASKDNRFIILKPTKPIKATLEKYGYPFKSKQHSHNLSIYQHSGIGTSIKRYLGIIESTTKFRCPKMLEYQFTTEFQIKCSDNCCRKMKTEPIHKWEKTNNKYIALTGMRNSEGGERASIKGCILTDKQGNLKKFHPLIKVNDEWENWFVETKNIKLCDLYGTPFNFKRTGCKGCPFSLDLQKQLEIMERYLPNERKQCEIIWKPVYDEYRRLGYRLKKVEEIKLL
jgi:3'-phosphoadenosine 5'-phosphosulfate sulfotransferase (PAPS reductase)/FAD synthetase